MNRVYRFLSLALVLVVMVMLLSGCTASKSTVEAYATTAWKSCGRNTVPAQVGSIHYTDPSALSSRMALPEDGLLVLPNCGYAFVFAPSGAGFDGMTAVFMDEAGNVITALDYTILYLDYDALGEDTPLQKAAFLNASNYMAFMYMEMLDSAAPTTADAKTNQWCTFSKEQIQAMVK